MVGKALTTLIVALSLFGAASAPAAAAAPVTVLAAGSYRDQRAVLYAQSEEIWLQRLNADGTLKGARQHFSFDGAEFGGQQLSITLSPHGTLVSDVMYTETGSGDPYYGAVFQFTYNNGQGWFGRPCPAGGDGDGPTGQGTAAWNGSIYLLASTCDGGGDSIPSLTVATFDPDGPNTRLVDIPFDEATEPEVTTAGGQFALAYQRPGSDGRYDVRVQRFAADGDYLGVTDLAAGPGAQVDPTIASSGGKYLVAWADVPTGDIYGRTLTTGGERSAFKKLVGASSNQHRPTAASGSSGTWHLAWTDARSGNADVYNAKVSPTMVVSPVNGRRLAGGVGPQQSPAIATRPNGAAFVAFLDQAVGKVRDLNASGEPTGEAKTVTVAPK